MRKEDLSQEILDRVMIFCDLMLLEDKGNFQGKNIFEFADYVLDISVYKKREETEGLQKVREEKLKKQSTPFFIGSFWVAHYRREIKVDYGNATPRDMKIFKDLLNEYGAEKVEGMIIWYLKNFRTLKGHNEEPSVPGLMGYRKSIAFNLFSVKTEGQVKEDKKNEKLDNLGVKI